MLLKVKKPTCHREISILEEDLLKILKHVLEADYLVPTEESDPESLPEEFVKFINSELRVQKLTNYKPIRLALHKILEWKQKEVEIAIATFKHDIKFANHLDERGVFFKIRDSEMTEKMKKFMIPFYDRLGDGYQIKHENEVVTYLDRNRIIHTYMEENRPMKRHLLCPACLEDLRPMLSKGILSDLDHYFPKSKYPTLAINADNLIPVCMSCNQRLKGDRDPLDPLNTQDTGCFSTVYLPFHRDAIKDIKVSFENQFENRKLDCDILDQSWVSEQVKIEASQSGDMVTKKAVNHLNFLYQLDEQWGGRLEGIFTDLINDISFELGNAEVTQGRVASLLILEYEKVRRKATISPNAYLIGCYIRYLLVSEQRLTRFCKEIRDSNKDSSDDGTMFEEYRELFDDVLGDLPYKQILSTSNVT